MCCWCKLNDRVLKKSTILVWLRLKDAKNNSLTKKQTFSDVRGKSGNVTSAPPDCKCPSNLSIYLFFKSTVLIMLAVFCFFGWLKFISLVSVLCWPVAVRGNNLSMLSHCNTKTERGREADSRLKPNWHKQTTSKWRLLFIWRRERGGEGKKERKFIWYATVRRAFSHAK